MLGSVSLQDLGYNKNEVLLKCIDVVKSFFLPDRRQINQPIITQELQQELALVDGVASLVTRRKS